MPVRYRGEILDPISVTMGIAVFPKHGETSKTPLLTADEVLTRAKAEGRDRVAVG
ncbi:MAG: hypothetical protein AB1553_04220 [Nitrospirota bacterium]